MMNISTLTDGITLTHQKFAIEIVENSVQLREVFQLRHQVYCVEREYEPGDRGEETDEYDPRSRHVLLRHTHDGGVVGTVRLIAPDPANLGDSFPMQRLCALALLHHLPMRTTGEISRFAISKQRRMGFRDAMLIRLALLRGVVQVSSEMGLTHWLAVMDRSLIRLHRSNEIYFEPVGSLVSHHGVRQPTFGVITLVLNRIRREQFPTWNYLTDGGRWFGRHEGIGHIGQSFPNHGSETGGSGSSALAECLT
jgi:N-acyl-L-homoserine lactone synthetase